MNNGAIIEKRFTKAMPEGVSISINLNLTPWNKTDLWVCDVKKGIAAVSFKYSTGLAQRVDGKPSVPHFAAVMQCMLAESAIGEMTFEEFCIDSGHCNTSEKSFSIYMQCVGSRWKLQAIFTKKELNRFKRILKNY